MTSDLFGPIISGKEKAAAALLPVAVSCGVEKFNAVWRQAVTLRPSARHEIDWMLREHYLGCWPGVTVAHLAVFCGETPVGCIVYALPPRETMKRYGGMTWELARLWLHDALPRNAETWVIGKSVKWIKRHRPDVVSLVSYADPKQGHAGVIYKAANWQEDGRTDMERKTPRFDYRDKHSGKIYSRRGHVPEGAEIERAPRHSKWRFVMPLRPAPAATVGPPPACPPHSSAPPPGSPPP